MKKLAILVVLIMPISVFAGVMLAFAQSSPNWPTGYNPTTAEINAAFAQKLDQTNGTFNGIVNATTLNVSGASVLSGSFSVTGASTLGAVSVGTFSTSGASTFGSAIAGSSGTLNVTGNQAVSGNETVGGTLGVTGASTLASAAVSSLTIGGSIAYAGHGLIGVQTFCASGCTHTSTGTYTPDAGTNQVVIEQVAAGGGSGGCGGTTSGQSCVGGSAASGSYAKVLFTSSFSGIPITIGAAGAAGTNVPGAGGTGGTTSAGALISCPGGTGGGAGSTFNIAVWSPAAANVAGPAACTISGGTIIASVAGQASGEGFTYLNASGDQFPGNGGAGPLSTASSSGTTAATVTGVSGTGYGWGAGGSVNALSQTATVGRAGGPSFTAIYEFN